METLAPLPTKKLNPEVLLREAVPLVTRSVLVPALLRWREQRHLRLHHRARLLHYLRAHPAMAVGATALGALAVGAFSIGALAIGALAIGKLALGKADIKQVHIHSLQVDALSLPPRAAT